LAIDDEGRVWVGSRRRQDKGSLSVLAPDGSWTTYTSKTSGLESDKIEALAVDNVGHIWVGTDDYLSRFDEGASTSKKILEPIALVKTLLEISIILTAFAVVILVIGIRRRRRKQIKIPAPEPTPIVVHLAPQEQPGTLSVPATEVSQDPEIALAKAKVLLSQGNREESVALLMQAFRAGSPEVRREAMRMLEDLGETKTF
jgi:hypothetical protein